MNEPRAQFEAQARRDRERAAELDDQDDMLRTYLERRARWNEWLAAQAGERE